MAFIKENGIVEVWDLLNPKKIQEIVVGCRSGRIAYSMQGTKLAVGNGCKFQIWDIPTGTLQQEFTAERGALLEMGFSTDGTRLFYVAEHGRGAWDLISGQPLYAIPTATGEYYGLAAIQENVSAAGTWNTPIQFYDPLSGQHLYDFASREGSNIMAFSPNGRIMAWNNYNKIDLVDSASGLDLLSIAFLYPNLLAFSPDNQTLAASSGDMTVHLWDVSTVIQRAKTAIIQTATPVATVSPPPTPTLEPILPLSLQPLIPPALEPDAIRPDNLAHLEMLGELGWEIVSTATWSPDGKILALGGSRGIFIFEAGASTPTRYFPTDKGLRLLAFSLDGNFLAGQISNAAIQVWEVSTGNRLYELENIGCWNQGMAFSADGQVLSARCGGLTYQWSLTNGQLLNKKEENIPFADLSPDGHYIVQVGMTQARLLASGKAETIQTFDVPGMAPALAKFSPDGKTLLVWFYQFEVGRTGFYYPTQNSQSLIQLWNIFPDQSPTLRVTLSTDVGPPDYGDVSEAFQEISFTPDSSRLAAASNGHIQIWDTHTGALLYTLSDGNHIYFSPDGNQLVSLGKVVKVWNITPGEIPLVGWENTKFGSYSYPPFLTLTFSQDGQALISASNGTYRFWQKVGLSFVEPAFTLNTPEISANIMAISPNREWLAYTTSDSLILGQNNGDHDNWRVLETIVDFPYHLPKNAMAFSPDSTKLAVLGALDEKVHVWTLSTSAPASIDFPCETRLHTLLFSPDGKLLLGAGSYAEQTILYLWDSTTGAQLRKWQVPENLFLFAFHPDAITLAAANYENGTLQVFDLRTGIMLREIIVDSNVNAIKFSPDGSLLVTCGDEIRFWEVSSGKLLKAIEGSFYQLAFSPDGKLLAISLVGSKIQYWGLPEK